VGLKQRIPEGPLGRGAQPQSNQRGIETRNMAVEVMKDLKASIEPAWD